MSRMKNHSPLALLTALCLLIGSYGCKKAAETNVQRYPIEGRIVSLQPSEHTITLAHHDIPGYMKAMTMPFAVHDDWVFKTAHPGDTLRATLVVADEPFLEHISVTQAADAAELSSTSAVHLPMEGELVPDFHFINQQGRQIHLAQFRGEPLLITFIYTRCPLPNFCVRMSNNFAEIARQLKSSSPAAFGKLQMLSITIDPEFDDPKVLLSYGHAYAGKVDPTLAHWSFATGRPEQIREASQFFGLSYQTQDNQIIHDLSTVLLDSDGKVAEFYRGNQWEPGVIASRIVVLQK
jgi:protein SCO1/2